MGKKKVVFWVPFSTFTKGKMHYSNDIVMSSSIIGNIDVTVHGTSGEDSLETVLL